MEDLIRLIVQQANITEEQARTTINTILGYVRTQLPAPMAAQLESFLASGGMNSLPGLTDLLKGLGGMLPGAPGSPTDPLPPR
jgi:hypothetical protein